MKPLIVLGSTGSIGTQTLEVAAGLDVEVAAIGARRGSPLLLEQAARLPETGVAVAAPTREERANLEAALGYRVAFGPEALEDLAARPGHTVVNGVVGAAGLEPSVAALEAGNRLALANKESLVAGGEVVMAAANRGGGTLVPVDSEHSAIAQCLAGEDAGAVRRIVLTASGGPFRGMEEGELAEVTVSQALAHPTWSMGDRVSIDSASLMNKAFEVIEAHFLFGVPYEAVDVVVHPESIVHSMVEFVDGSIKAQLGAPDMRLPIQYAITAPGRKARPSPGEGLPAELHFEQPNRAAFPSLDLGYRAGREGGSSGAVLNAADEIAVQAFLDGRIGFTSIPAVVERALDDVEQRSVASVADVLAADREARAAAHEAIGRSC